MNRRGFLSALLKAGVGAMVLPSAATYARRWKLDKGLLKPSWYRCVQLKGGGVQDLILLASILDEFKRTVQPLEMFSGDGFEWTPVKSYGIGDVVAVKLSEQTK